MNRIEKCIRKPRKIIKALGDAGLLKWMPDELYLKLRYYSVFGKRLNLKNPVTFNEKMQWMKLNDRKDIYTVMVDKCEAKKYVASIIGEEYIIPTLGVWESADEIDFDSLPVKFVMKPTHDSGGIRIVDKASEDYDPEELRAFFKARLKRNFYYLEREWPYKNVKPRIIAEEYMEDRDCGELRDYKFFCFDGHVKAMFIASDRFSKERPTAFDFFDADFHWLDVRQGHPNALTRPEKPVNFELMKTLSEKLSKGFSELRVDLYEINGKVYFGELTLFHHAALTPFDPESWDEIFGNWMNGSET